MQTFPVTIAAHMVNTQSWTIIHFPHREYTSNNPQYPDSSGFSFISNRAVIADIGFAFHIKQRYYTSPNLKSVIGSKYPEFRINYKKGMGDVNYDF